ncbi:MAG: MBL fold metallo-hydrolase [Cognaticolwellia sp.]
MKYISSLVICWLVTACSNNEHRAIRVQVDFNGHNNNVLLQQQQWQHGSENCDSAKIPAIEVFRYQASSYILRQNKCQHFEAPFMYLLLGESKALLLDTGAVESELEFPLYQKVNQLMQQHAQETATGVRELIVLHSHGHSDHYAADSQFIDKAKVSVVLPSNQALAQFFSEHRVDEHSVISLELGKRKITIIPTPGHQEEAITLYDEKTQWLLTGDSLYPGLVYVKHWQDYRESIKTLYEFSQKNKVSAVLGAHIEMKSSIGEYYEIGSTYQPNEASLTLNIELLQALHKELEKYPEPRKLIFDQFIIAPMTGLQRSLSDISRLVTQ